MTTIATKTATFANTARKPLAIRVVGWVVEKNRAYRDNLHVDELSSEHRADVGLPPRHSATRVRPVETSGW